VRPVYKRVDTCAAEFATRRLPVLDLRGRSARPSRPRARRSWCWAAGPNRIGQGIEFDYCCVHAALALREDGYETIMVNCNPETVSTDYDTSDRLYFEPLTLEDVLEIVDKEKPVGVIVQYGGQTPLKLALDLEANGVPIIGTSPT
jgi:carbamoyl-phosphate synthase large subunit